MKNLGKIEKLAHPRFTVRCILSVGLRFIVTLLRCTAGNLYFPLRDMCALALIKSIKSAMGVRL